MELQEDWEQIRHLFSLLRSQPSLLPLLFRENEMLIDAVSSEISQHSFLILSNYLFAQHPPLCYKWYPVSSSWKALLLFSLGQCLHLSWSQSKIELIYLTFSAFSSWFNPFSLQLTLLLFKLPLASPFLCCSWSLLLHRILWSLYFPNSYSHLSPLNAGLYHLLVSGFRK